MDRFTGIKALTFDIYGTVLDLGGSLKPFIARFLQARGLNLSVEQFWGDWRARQRIEQFQDSLLMLGHSGYLETSRRACVYTLGLHGISTTAVEVKGIMAGWEELSPFPDVVGALDRLKGRYKLMALSNGEPEYLQRMLRNRIRFDFDASLSVDAVGAFKPHPAVYRRAAAVLGLEVGQCMMVTAHSFDAVGARASGFKAAYVNRYRLPYDDTPYRPQVVVKDFTELADALL